LAAVDGSFRAAHIAKGSFERTEDTSLATRNLLFGFGEWRTELDLFEKVSDDRLTIQSRCATLLNVHLACLYTAIHNATTPGLVARHIEISPFEMILLHQNAEQNVGALYEMSPFAWEDLVHRLSRVPRVYDRTDVTIEVLNESFSLFEKLLASSDGYLPTVVEILLRARNSLESSDYVVSLTLAWSAIEYLLNTLWERFLVNNRTRKVEGQDLVFINAKRKTALTSTDFTASIVSEILSLNETVPFDLYEKITLARKARNAWLHRLQPVQRKDSEIAIDSAREMLKLVHGIDLRWYFVHHNLRG
jgi:hypothetical protein